MHCWLINTSQSKPQTVAANLTQFYYYEKEMKMIGPQSIVSYFITLMCLFQLITCLGKYLFCNTHICSDLDNSFTKH